MSSTGTLRSLASPDNGDQGRFQVRPTNAPSVRQFLPRSSRAPSMGGMGMASRIGADERSASSSTSESWRLPAALGLLLLVVVLLSGASSAAAIGMSSSGPTSPVGKWRSTTPMLGTRHLRCVAHDGRVLVAGGFGTNSLVKAAAEVYDSGSQTWTRTGPMVVARGIIKAVLLPSGKVLVAGGRNTATACEKSAELYDPASGTRALTGSMSVARESYTATLLPSGKVLVVEHVMLQLHRERRTLRPCFRYVDERARWVADRSTYGNSSSRR